MARPVGRGAEAERQRPGAAVPGEGEGRPGRRDRGLLPAVRHAVRGGPRPVHDRPGRQAEGHHPRLRAVPVHRLVLPARHRPVRGTPRAGVHRRVGVEPRAVPDQAGPRPQRRPEMGDRRAHQRGVQRCPAHPTRGAVRAGPDRTGVPGAHLAGHAAAVRRGDPVRRARCGDPAQGGARHRMAARGDQPGRLRDLRRRPARQGEAGPPRAGQPAPGRPGLGTGMAGLQGVRGRGAAAHPDRGGRTAEERPGAGPRLRPAVRPGAVGHQGCGGETEDRDRQRVRRGAPRCRRCVHGPPAGVRGEPAARPRPVRLPGRGRVQGDPVRHRDRRRRHRVQPAHRPAYPVCRNERRGQSPCTFNNFAGAGFGPFSDRLGDQR